MPNLALEDLQPLCLALPHNLTATGQVWQAAAAVQHSGANLEQGIAFLLEGHLDNEAAAYRYLEAAGDKLPDIDVSGAMHQVTFLWRVLCMSHRPGHVALPDAPNNQLPVYKSRIFLQLLES